MNNLISEHKLEELRQKVNDDISSDTLHQLSILLHDQCCDKRCYELVTIGVINSLRKKRSKQFENSIWYKEARLICYQKLLNQDNCSSNVHIFLGTVAALQSSGEHWAIPAIAKEFEIVLRPIYDKKLLNKNAILCLLIVRNFLGDWISQDEISNLHLNTFAEFTRGDLSLPYSNLFESAVYYRNVSDLKHFIYNAEIRNNLKLFHWVLITWLFNSESLYPYNQSNLIDLIKNKISQHPISKYEFEAASAKTLLAHHARDLKTSNYTKLQDLVRELDDNNSFYSILDFFAENQTQIKKLLTGNKSAKFVNNLQKKTYLGMMGIKNIIEGRTGVSLTSRKKIKVAICVSGQLRGYKKAFETWKKSILVGIDYDIYVHSWENLGGTNAEPYRKFLPFQGENFKKGYVEYCMIFGFEQIKKDYPTLFKYLRQSAQVTAEEIKLFYGAKNVVLEDESMPKFDGFTNSDKMHYKINACHKLMKSSDKHYDLVIRIRPDFSISFVAFNWNDIYDWCRAESIIFADLPFGTNYMTCMMGDQLAVGSPEMLDIYANTWDIYPKISPHKLLGCEIGFMGHTSIAMNCWIHNIKIQKLPMKKNGLLESSTMSNRRISEAVSIDAVGRNSIWDQKFLAMLKEDAAS